MGWCSSAGQCDAERLYDLQPPITQRENDKKRPLSFLLLFSTSVYGLRLSRACLGKSPRFFHDKEERRENSSQTWSFCVRFFLIPKVTGAIARTNYSPSSIFRGAGQPQTAFIMESAMEALCQRITGPAAASAAAAVPRGIAIRRANLVADGCGKRLLQILFWFK